MEQTKYMTFVSTDCLILGGKGKEQTKYRAFASIARNIMFHLITSLIWQPVIFNCTKLHTFSYDPLDSPSEIMAKCIEYTHKACVSSHIHLQIVACCK
jgi:hypothetical protein